MNFFKLLLLNLLLILPAGGATAAARVPVKSVNTWLEQILILNARKDCSVIEHGVLKVDRKNLVHEINANNDEVPDYIIDMNGFSCSTAASLWSGTAGRVVMILASDKDVNNNDVLWNIVFDASIQDWSWNAAKQQLKFYNHGASVGSEGNWVTWKYDDYLKQNAWENH